MSKRAILPSIAIVIAVAAAPVSAQLLGGNAGGLLGQVGGVIDQTLGSPASPSAGTGPVNSGVPSPALLDRVSPPIRATVSNASQLLEARRARLSDLIRSNRHSLDRDSAGQPVRRDAIMVLDGDDASLGHAARAGFRIARDERVGELGVRMTTLAPPAGMNVRDAMKRLTKAAPALAVDFDHIYEPAGGALVPIAGMSLALSPSVRPGTRIAMIDGGIGRHPSLARASIEQRGFAGPAQPTGHGTAVGSLIVGTDRNFRGAAPSAHLFVGDVYGGNVASGSASVIVRALSWAASKRPAVINISLVGPRNALLERAIAAVQSKGIPVVAAVGNDGPAAPPQYPASYPQVVAVTAVDAGNRALREAGRAAHLDFAAPGADLAAAVPGRGYAAVRGTSFAAPLVSARLAATGSTARLAVEAVPGKGKVGRGIVCRPCRNAPGAVGAK